MNLRVLASPRGSVRRNAPAVAADEVQDPN
jgi:hypothetical protein